MPDVVPPLWYATLLGAARIEGPLGPVERLRTRTAFVLLVFLLLNCARSHAREELIDRFWPEDAPETARGKLRLALHSIRSALGDILDADRTAVRVAQPERVHSDRDELLRLVASAEGDGRFERLKRAVALYRGPFLPGFYDDWAVAERERLESTVARALRELATRDADAGRWTEALDAANRLIALEPYDEAAHVLALRSLRALGRPEAVARTLDWIRERFAEIGSRPGEATEAFAREVPSSIDEPDEGPAFLGRDAEVARVVRAVERGMVTLWGPPGVGKTRLAQAVLSEVGGRTAFVSAVGVESLEALGGFLRIAFGDGLEGGGELLDIAEAALPATIVVDNFESLPEAAAGLFVQLRKRNRGLRFLFTSQRRLGIEGETVISVAGLDVPPEGASLAQIAVSPSIRLLRERVRERGRRLRVDDSNAAALGRLCRRLEGLPLALELAAEWLDVLGPAEIVARLDDSRRLVARLPGRDPRHLSLDAAIAASLERLDASARRALQALATFVGGWDAVSAEAVCGDDVAPILAELESRSLVFVEPRGERVRYGMLDAIRLYVLASTPEEQRAEDRRRHAEHFVGIGAAMEADSTSLVERYRADDENVRQAAETILEIEPNPERAARSIGGFQGFWQKTGRWNLAEASLRRALDRLPPEPTPLRARLYVWLAYVGYNTDDLPLAEWATARRCEICETLGDLHELAMAQGGLGILRAALGDFSGAVPLVRQYLAATEVKNDGFYGGQRLIAMTNLGNILLNVGDEAEGLAILERSVGLANEAGADRMMGYACVSLGWRMRLRGRLAEAEAHLRRGTDLYRRVGDRPLTITGMCGLATTLTDRGNLADARDVLHDAADLAAQVGRPTGYGDLAEAGAWLASASGRSILAARLVGAARFWRRRAHVLGPLHVARIAELEGVLADALGSEGLAAETLRGETLSRAELVEGLRQAVDGA